MRSFILSLPQRLHLIIIVGSTMIMAFAVASICAQFFDAHQLKDNTDLISAVYQVMGTIYAILLTFTLWGVWQSYTLADSAVQKEAYTLMDLVHMIEMTPRWKSIDIRFEALAYAEAVVRDEWIAFKDINSAAINIRERNHAICLKIMDQLQSISPQGEREDSIFSQALQLMTALMDARRARILSARGNSASALWVLLLTGAAVLFAFNGLFIAESIGIWTTLLGGTSLVIGLTFFLIFSLDCPFAGSPCIDSEPFRLAIELLKQPSSSNESLQESMVTL